MDVKIADSWKDVLAGEFSKSYFPDLADFVRREYSAGPVFPRGGHIFRAFDRCSFDALRVVVLGQDPYHGPGQANGLCFSVDAGIAFPPSLHNIFTEVGSDTGAPRPCDGNLDRWAEQGVLLLNSVLTVRAHQAASHAGMGWERFTDAVVKAVADQKQNVVFMLWGNYAQQKASFVDSTRHCILKSVHPSPLSAHRGFFGCRHFSQANQYLAAHGQQPIIW